MYLKSKWTDALGRSGRLTWAASLSGFGGPVRKNPETSANARLLGDRDSSFSYAVVRPGGIACGCDDAGTVRRLLGGSRCTPDTSCVRTQGGLRATCRVRVGDCIRTPWSAGASAQDAGTGIPGAGARGKSATTRSSAVRVPAALATVSAAAPTAVPGARAAASHRQDRAAVPRVPGRWPLLALLAVLAVQAVLSLRLVRADTAFQDEAAYLWAGHLQWAHWLHGTPLPPFPAYFSGAPVIYPPLAALADSARGPGRGADPVAGLHARGDRVAVGCRWAVVRAAGGVLRRCAVRCAGPDVASGGVRHLRRHGGVPGGAGGLARGACWGRPGRDRLDGGGGSGAGAG